MMQIVFADSIQAGIASGAYEVVKNNATGQFIGLARDTTTKKFVAHAIGTIANEAPGVTLLGLNPPMGAAMIAGKVISAAQNQAILGKINALQASLGVLQATTAFIGVGVVATTALSAVNLWQTLKLKREVQQMRLEIRQGFLDLKQALRDQGLEVIQHIDEVAKDIKFEQHRLELIKAYSKFLEATRLIKTALVIENIDTRKIELSNARQTLSEALAIYNSPHLLSETTAIGQLRRFECAWTIEQTLVLTYHLQDEPAATINRLEDLQQKIRQDSLTVIDRCESQEELDFLFPEITSIHNRDLALLEVWQNQVDWARSLPPAEQVELANLPTISQETVTMVEVSKPPELLKYEELQSKSHFPSLVDQLRLLFDQGLREEYEVYVSEKAQDAGYKSLLKPNLEKASYLAIANLYWYFKIRDESEDEDLTQDSNNESVSQLENQEQSTSANNPLSDTQSQIFEITKKLIIKQLQVASNRVTINSHLSNDLGADSLDAVELIMALEEEFDIEIPDEDAEKVTTVKQVVDYIYQKSLLRYF